MANDQDDHPGPTSPCNASAHPAERMGTHRGRRRRAVVAFARPFDLAVLEASRMSKCSA
jgi:hypothetical protein